MDIQEKGKSFIKTFFLRILETKLTNINFIICKTDRAWTRDFLPIFIKDNKDLVWVNGRNQGYVSLNITELDVEVQFKYVSTVKSKEYEVLEPYVFRVEHNKPYS